MGKYNMQEVYERILPVVEHGYRGLANGRKLGMSFLDEVYNILKNSDYGKYWVEGEVEVGDDGKIMTILTNNKAAFPDLAEEEWFCEIIRFLEDVRNRDEYGDAVAGEVARVDVKCCQDFMASAK